MSRKPETLLIETYAADGSEMSFYVPLDNPDGLYQSETYVADMQWPAGTMFYKVNDKERASGLFGEQNDASHNVRLSVGALKAFAGIAHTTSVYSDTLGWVDGYEYGL